MKNSLLTVIAVVFYQQPRYCLTFVEHSIILKVLLLPVIIFGVYAVIYNLAYSYDSSSAKMKVLDLSDTANPFYISEKHYAASVNNVILPCVDNLQTTGTFKNGGHTIAYNIYLLDTPKANVVISHGFTERKEKYKELIYYFLKMGYQVFILDHYSHGASDRSTNDRSLVNVDSYAIFINDLTEFITGIVKKHSKGRKTVLFGHSMGGGIAAMTVQKHSEIVDGLILSSPMMKSRGLPPDFIANVIIKVMILLGKGSAYTAGSRRYNPELDKKYNPTPFTTHCTDKGEYWHNHILSITNQPSSGASWKASSVLLDITHDVVKKNSIKKIKVPILLLQAEEDRYVGQNGHYEFANKANNIDFYLIKEAGHEIYIEHDEITIPYFNKLQSFIEKIIV